MRLSSGLFIVSALVASVTSSWLPADEQEKVRRPVVLTLPAAKEILKVMQEAKLSKSARLRVSVSGNDRDGFQYGLGFDEISDEKLDIIYEMREVRMVVDKKSAIFLEGTSIDFTEKPKRGFTFDNPNAVKR